MEAKGKDKNMRKHGLVTTALLAVIAVWAISATTALGADEFLVGGATITATLSAEVEGHLILTALEGNAVLDQITCALIWTGTMVAKTMEITKWLNLAKEEIGAELVAPALSCTVSESAGGITDCLINTSAEVWPDNLPWIAAIELIGTAYTLDVGNGAKKPGYDFSCLAPIGTVSELCEGLTNFVLTNELGTSPATVLAEATSTAQKLNCTAVGTENGDVEKSDLDIWALEGGGGRLPTAVSN